jgi:hypothetical protein
VNSAPVKILNASIEEKARKFKHVYPLCWQIILAKKGLHRLSGAAPIIVAIFNRH